MIAKMAKGRGFRGALEYDLDKQKGRLIASNMASSTPRGLAAEFGAIRRLRPTLGRAVAHVSLSAAPGERLTDNQWRQIAGRYLKAMGFAGSQFVVTRHADTEHEHIHILANRITITGEVVSDAHDYKRQEVVMREIERDFGLRQVAPSKDVERRAPTKGEIEGALRTGRPSTRDQLQKLCDGAARGCSGFTEYLERLEAVGVELVPVVQMGGAKLSGLSYRLDGVTMKGSDLGKGYTAAGIQKKGISYEQDRDFAAVERCRERDARRAFGEPDRSSQAGQAQERRGLGASARTVGASDGRADRSDAGNLRRGRSEDESARAAVPNQVGPSNHGLGEGRGVGSSGSGQVEQGRQPHGVEALRPSRGDGFAFSGAHDRILVLASTSEGAKQLGRESDRGISAPGFDRSFEAVKRQINAMGAARYELGIRDAGTGKMMHRQGDTVGVLDSVQWLKRMNAKGNDIYIRPTGDHALVLLDDVKRLTIEQMKNDGWTPAATVETSPDNFQAWIKLADTPVSAEVRDVAAKGLAKRYEADPNSADAHHFGRLAGFTNQKPEHERDGKRPFVLAHECWGKVAQAASKTLQWIDGHLDRVKAAKERESRLERLESAKPGQGGAGPHARDPVREYQRQAQRLIERYGKDADLSKVDWMIATDMAKSGRFSADGIEQAIREHSPNVTSRKAGHVEDYARRTVAAAWASSEVQEHRQEQARIAAEAKKEQQAQRSSSGPKMGR